MFNSSTGNQSLYLDGVLDATRQSNNSYVGTSGALHIGFQSWSKEHRYYDGLIDQLSYTNRSKIPSEILRDATLTLYVSFDGNSIYDQGPLNINGSVGGSTTFVSGRRGQALQIGNVSDSYFTAPRLVLLGRYGQSYSFSIWIKPAAQQKSTIIHVSVYPDGTGWSLPMLGLSNTSQLIAVSWDGGGHRIFGPTIPTNSWTHAAITYSSNIGLRLYINGSLYNTSSPFEFHGSITPTYLFVGSSRATAISSWWPDVVGQYWGAVDELQVYSCELTAGEVNAFANPLP